MRRSRRLAVVVGVIFGVLLAGGATAALATGGVGQPCDNGANSDGCTVSGTEVTVIPESAPILGGTKVGVSSINVGGDNSCSGERTCGFNGTGPVAVGGDASCTGNGYGDNGCGVTGTGPVAVGGDASCSVYPTTYGYGAAGCGQTGTGPVAVDGNASCSANGYNAGGCGSFGTAPIAVGGDASCAADSPQAAGCGSLGTGPVAVGGNSSCSANLGCGGEGTGPIAVGGNASCSAAQGCGYLGTGPIATGDMSCDGKCGSSTTIYVPSVAPVFLPRTGTPGIAILGHAYCGTPFDAAQATDVNHLEAFQCISVADTISGLL